MQTDRLLYLGVDGGASHCRARLRDSQGALIAEAQGAGSNAYIDREAAVAAIAAQIDAVCARAGIVDAERGSVRLGVGLAGIVDTADEARIEARFPAFAAVRAVNDAVASCLGAHAGGDGALVVVGTGSAAIARVGGREVQIGGRGFLLGDDGSAARVGAEAIRAALRAYDGLGPATPFTDEILRRFGGDPLAAMQWALDAAPGGYGAYSPLVFEHAAAGDRVAAPIVAAAARAVDALIAAVRGLGAARVVMVGGMSAAIRSHLARESQASLSEPLHDATDGAILVAGGVFPVITEALQ